MDNHKDIIRQDFDWGMHYFRAFAIICIVTYHFFHGLGYVRTAEAIFKSSTIFFLFISGYLCEFVYEKKHTPALLYYKRKITNVITPYIIWSVITLAAVLLLGENRYGCIKTCELSSCKDWVKALAFGRAQWPYWYIPFVSVLFLVSPLIVRLKNEYLTVVSIATFFVSIILPTRGYPFTLEWPNFILMYTYFSFYYLAGFVYCRYREYVDVYLKKYVWLFCLFALITVAWLLKPKALDIVSVDVDLLRALQKLFITGIILVVLKGLKTRHIAILDEIASLSFTFYFLHMFFINDFAILRDYFACRWIALPLLLVYIIFLYIISKLLKLVFGKYSRYVIGS